MFFKGFYGKTEVIIVYVFLVFFSVNLILINRELFLLSILSIMKLFIFTSFNREFTQKWWIGLIMNISNRHIFKCMCHSRPLFIYLFENIAS